VSCFAASPSAQGFEFNAHCFDWSERQSFRAPNDRGDFLRQVAFGRLEHHAHALHPWDAEVDLFDSPAPERVEQRRGSAQTAIDVEPKLIHAKDYHSRYETLADGTDDGSAEEAK
jgi:hypothetical protein